MAEAPSKQTSTSGVETKSVHVGSKDSEDEIPLHLRSRRTRDPIVAMVEELSKETTKGRKLDMN